MNTAESRQESPKDTQAQTCEHLHKILPEFMEGYVVIGRCPVTGKGIIRYWAPTQEAADDMNELLKAAAAKGVKFEG